MKGVVLAMFAGILFAGYQFSIKLSAHQISELLGAVVLQAIALGLGIIAFFLLEPDKSNLVFTSRGIYYAILAGAFVGLAEIVSFYAFSTSLAPSVAITLIVGINILAGIFLDYFWFKSPLNISQWLGVILVLVGVLLICWKKV